MAECYIAKNDKIKAKSYLNTALYISELNKNKIQQQQINKLLNKIDTWFVCWFKESNSIINLE